MSLRLNQWGLAVDDRAPHLGGYLPGGDPGCWYPALWDWVIEAEEIQSVIDVGCGEGQSLDYFADKGCTVLGVDGIAQPHLAVAQHDFTTGPFLVHDFDLVWSCEFVEHVEERYLHNFLATFACGRLVLMTHAIPGQGGHHHVNCQPSEYWIEAMEGIGYILDAPFTEEARHLAGDAYFARTGLAFRRDE